MKGPPDNVMWRIFFDSDEACEKVQDSVCVCVCYLSSGSTASALGCSRTDELSRV